MAIQVLPAKIELSAEGPTKATVLVTNKGKTDVSDLRLQTILTGTSPDEATIAPQGPRILKAGQTRSYILALSPWLAPQSASTLSLLATFVSGGVRQVVATTAELTAPTPLAIEKVASVEVKASLQTLRSDQSEPVYLLVSNKSGQVLRVREVIASNPSFVEFDQLSRNVTVEPGETGVLKLEAHAKSKVRPGEHQLVFRLPSEIGGVGFDLVATTTAKVGVAGESEVLTILGVPSLLILPGFLLIATISLLWKLGMRPRAAGGKDFPLPLKEAEFWVLAVLFSIVIVAIAKARADIDLLGEYGLADLVRIWVGSMVAGAFLYLLFVLGANWWHSFRLPRGQDDPVTVLKKLGRQGLDIKRPEVSVDLGSGTPVPLFLLEPPSGARAETWACPAILISWGEDEDPALNARINEQLDRDHDAQALAELLREGEGSKKLTVSFEGGRTPVAVAKEKIGTGTPTVMVRQV